MDWNEALPYRQYIREHGVIQFLNLYDRLKDRTDVLRWGDEIEYMIIKRDDQQKKVYLSLRAKEILDELVKEETEYNKAVEKDPNTKPPVASWKPEYGRYMLEGTPFFPFEQSFLQCEENMFHRRMHAKTLLKDDESLVSLTMFPLMGAKPDLVYPPLKEPSHSVAESLFLPDEIINEHPRFPTLTRNIRLRRGDKVCILMPLFVDRNTDPTIGHRVPWPCNNRAKCCLSGLDHRMSQRSPTQCYLFTKSIQEECNPNRTLTPTLEYLLPNQGQSIVPIIETPSIYMDAMGFGMGCCCLQATFQARDIIEARNLYDQLAVLCPIFLALTAATPIVRGLLAETDVRWNIVSASVDDRTPDEKTYISKSRYDSISTFIGTSPESEKYSDLNIEIDKKVYNQLREHGIDHNLAKHIAYLFIRDPLVIFTDFKDHDDRVNTDHFENIQSTNWQTMRFKPPPAHSTIGWRVEFRVMEVQMSDFENAAFTVFIVLLTRVILTFNLNFYMPISKVDENMARAHKRDAVLLERFCFRKNIQDHNDFTCISLTVNEIINGKGDEFPGIVSFMHKYLDGIKDLSNLARTKLNNYISLVSKRASGELCTTANFIRNFVLQHSDYKQDSVVTETIAYDLIRLSDRVSSKQETPYELLGSISK
jgi:glutamate--cysteine ligase catalytic subunit